MMQFPGGELLDSLELGPGGINPYASGISHYQNRTGTANNHHQGPAGVSRLARKFPLTRLPLLLGCASSMMNVNIRTVANDARPSARG